MSISVWASEAQYASISETFESLRIAKASKLVDIKSLENQFPKSNGVEEELAGAMAQRSKLLSLAADAENLRALTELFKQINVQLFLRSQPHRKKKQIVNKMRRDYNLGR